MDPSLAASVVVRNKNNVWIDDDVVATCHNCLSQFGFFVRKHHCRNCGNIFCYNCINKAITIPTFITDRPDAADYWNPSYYITSLKGNTEKVCEQCYDMIHEKTKAYQKIVEIFNNPVSIDNIKDLSESSNDIKNHYFDHLRNMQYYLPNHKYSEIDKKLLRVNAENFSQHSKYIVQLIKSIDWVNSPDLNLITKVIKGTKTKDCSDLFCTRTCQDCLSCDDCINILYSTQNLPDPIIKFLFSVIALTPETVILCQLPFFIRLIKGNSSNKFLQTLLFELLTKSTKLTYHTYWLLNNAKEISNIQEMSNINTFIDLFDKDLSKQMNQEYMFFVGLVDHLDDPKKYLVNVFDRYKPISLPYEPSIKLIAVELESITIKSSYTKPVMISFWTNGGEKITLLFKKENIMNDLTVLNLMTLCDIILRETLCDENFNVVVYPLMPLTSNSGIIEIIDRAETVHSITNKKRTIFQYIIDKNENQRIGDVMNRYMYSLVSYTLHSYFLGLGDRHLQNIMITEDGSIFHIDFGFILGTDSYPLPSSNIKLNSDMLDVIGGSDSRRYDLYLDFCAKGITILRKYFNMFFILLCQNNRFSEKFVEKFVMLRFQPRQVDSVVICELMTIIKYSHNAYSAHIRDFLHYHTQERTVQHGMVKAIKNTLGTVNSLRS